MVKSAAQRSAEYRRRKKEQDPEYLQREAARRRAKYQPRRQMELRKKEAIREYGRITTARYRMKKKGAYDVGPIAGGSRDEDDAPARRSARLQEGLTGYGAHFDTSNRQEAYDHRGAEINLGWSSTEQTTVKQELDSDNLETDVELTFFKTEEESTNLERLGNLCSMEVCVDSVESAINAEKGGACRVELCANLMEGGTTPSIGMLRVMKKKIAIPVYTMIRPRGGDFLYSDLEYDVMAADIQLLKEAGADGVVLGVLTSDGSVDVERCKGLIDIARPLPVTFHRAIDMCRDISQALENVIGLGCERILSSGGESTALEGAPAIASMIEQAAERIIIVPGGGIHERNLGRILESTGAKEFHGSARASISSDMAFKKSGITMGAALSPPEFSVKITDDSKVKDFLTIAQLFWNR